MFYCYLPGSNNVMVNWSNAIYPRLAPHHHHFFWDLRYPFLPSAHFLLSLFATQEGNKLVGMSGNIDMNQSTTNLSHLPRQFAKSWAPSAKSCKNFILNYYLWHLIGAAGIMDIMSQRLLFIFPKFFFEFFVWHLFHKDMKIENCSELD